MLGIYLRLFARLFPFGDIYTFKDNLVMRNEYLEKITIVKISLVLYHEP